MTTPEDAKLLISDAAATFPAIIGAPTDDDLKTIREFLTNLLQSIEVAGGNDSLSGLVDNPAAYAAAGLSYDTKFNLGKVLELPFNDVFFSVPPHAPHGQIPRLGTLHPSIVRFAAAAFAAASSARPRPRGRPAPR